MDTSANPIFLLGFPRSGTTWFGKFLDAHPDVLYRHEPFGRHHAQFTCYESLKQTGIISEDQRSMTLDILRAESPAYTKPPFFRKSFRGGCLAQKAAWTLARSVPAMRSTYQSMFAARGAACLVIKETRSEVGLANIINGIRADRLLFLIRDPRAAIASYITGIRSGLIQPVDAAMRREWTEYHPQYKHSQNEILRMSEAEYLALTWRAQNEEYMRMADTHPCSLIVGYENFALGGRESARIVLRFMGLKPHRQVDQFLLGSDKGSKRYYSVFKGFDPDQWKSVLSKEDVRLVDRHTRELWIYSSRHKAARVQ